MNIYEKQKQKPNCLRKIEKGNVMSLVKAYSQALQGKKGFGHTQN